MKREKLAHLGAELIAGLDCNGSNTSDVLRAGSAMVGIVAAAASKICESIEGARSPVGPTALDLLHTWISRDPTYRAVDRMARIDDKVLVELRSKSGVFTSTTQLEFDPALRTVLMIAYQNGEP